MRVHAIAMKQAGFSLVELMVALVLGLILTSGVISVYITSKNTYSVNNALGAVQQHGRFAFTFMDPTIRMANYTGGKYIPSPNNDLTGGLNTDPVYFGVAGVYGYDANGTGVNGSLDTNANPSYETTPPQDPSLWTPALDANSHSTLYDAIKSTVLQGSDVFLVSQMQQYPPELTGAQENDLVLTVNTADEDAQGNAVNDTSYFQVGSIAMVSNCLGAGDVFAVTAVDSAAGTITANNLLNPSHAGSYGTVGQLNNVGLLVTYIYWVGSGTDGTPSLYRTYLDKTGVLAIPQELVSGIENMQVLYGVKAAGVTQGPPVRYEAADTIDAANNWTNVVSVRVALIAQSDDNSIDTKPTATSPFFMLASDPVANVNNDGMQFTPPLDRRLRRYFVQTFSVRNALP